MSEAFVPRPQSRTKRLLRWTITLSVVAGLSWGAYAFVEHLRETSARSH